MLYDVLVIGGGVTGCAILRQLSRKKLKVALAEAREDVAMGASRANSAIVHAGYDAAPGTLMALLNVRGNAMYDEWSAELEVMLYDAHVAKEFAERMLAKGVYVVSFCYPVVPQGKARIRTQVSAAHTLDDLRFAVSCFTEVKREMGL